MAFYGDRIPKFLKEATPEKLETKLMQLGAAMGQKVEIINIYESRNGGVVAWYFQDTKVMGAGSPRKDEEKSSEEEKPKPRRRRRKAGS